jgi:hypothetical protein
MKKNLILIGPYPDPKGGVSIHIKRLKSLLANDLEIKLIDESPIKKKNLFNIRSLNLFKYLRLISWSNFIHIHSSPLILRFLHITIAKLFSKKVIVSIHAFRPSSKIQILLNRAFLNICDHVIVVNEEIPKKLNLKKYHLQPAFIPPDMESEPRLPKHITELVLDKINQQQQIVVANAFRIDFHNNEDIYGIDLCINAMDELINNRNNRNICLIYIISSLSKSNDAFNRYTNIIREKKLEDSFFLINESISFVKLIQISDIVLRPTSTDGDALTIREGLFLQKRVIASDVIERPEETILYKNQDFQDLALKLEQEISGSNGKFYQENFLPEYKTIYQDIYLK